MTDRINRLLDPAKMREKAKQQKENEQHIQRLLRALPAAFNYAYSGTETTPQGHQLVKLEFSPNPAFVPPDRETQVYQGMKGHVWINTRAMRLAKIDGTLYRDVDFGWGVIGRLYKGGRFVVEQADVGNGHWDTVRMDMKFDGKILMVKHLHHRRDGNRVGFPPSAQDERAAGARHAPPIRRSARIGPSGARQNQGCYVLFGFA